MPFSLSNIVIVGGGKMGEAILAGLLSATLGPAAGLKRESCVIVNPGLERRIYLQDTYGIHCVEALRYIERASFVILAVKPQVMASVLQELSQQTWIDNSCVLSVAAGVSTRSIEAALPESCSVLRAMPNTPLTIGHGASALCKGSRAQMQDLNLAQEIFSTFGLAVVVEESALDAVTAISGSGPAYVAALVEAMARSGQEAGLDFGLAEQLAIATVEGTGALMQQTGQGAVKTREDVCSPGGTTLAALDAMQHNGFSESIAAGVHAAIRRSKELSC